MIIILSYSGVRVPLAARIVPLVLLSVAPFVLTQIWIFRATGLRRSSALSWRADRNVVVYLLGSLPRTTQILAGIGFVGFWLLMAIQFTEMRGGSPGRSGDQYTLTNHGTATVVSHQTYLRALSAEDRIPAACLGGFAVGAAALAFGLSQTRIALELTAMQVQPSARLCKFCREDYPQRYRRIGETEWFWLCPVCDSVYPAKGTIADPVSLEEVIPVRRGGNPREQIERVPNDFM
jgi:hypothetical protein